MTRPTILSLFSGIGGLELGIETVMPTTRVVFGVELDAFRADIFRRRFACDVWPDIYTFNGCWCKGVDIVTAGFPCQAFSTAARGRNRRERNLWREAARVIYESGPSAVFLENVWAIGEYLRVVRDDLRGMGYCVPPPLFTNSAAVGAPHERRRVWVLAHSDGKSKWIGAFNEEMARVRTLAIAHRWSGGPGWILGMDDGIPARMVERRALGDAVIPAQAALALLSLMRRAEMTRIEEMP